MEEEIWFIEKDGKRRRGFYQTCLNCKNEFISPVRKPHKYCGHNCKNEFKTLNGKKEVQCAVCNKKFYKKISGLKNSKSGLYFCSRKCKDDGQRLGGIKEIMPPHYGISNAAICKRLIKGEHVCCCDCGDKRRYLLCIHHIDGDHRHNVMENLEIVCWSCHAKRHLIMVDDNWIYNPNYLTPRHLLLSL